MHAAPHLTLLFLGDTDPELVPDLRAGLEEVASRHGSFDVELGDAGAFGGRGRPRVAWLGVRRGSTEITDLASAVAMRVLGDDPNRRPLTAHLTVARRAAPDLAEQLRRAVELAPPIAWIAEELELVRSHLEAAGPRYEVLARAPFADAGVGAHRADRSAP